MIYALCFLLGFGFAVSGGVSVILYLNFIPAGLSFIDYLLIIQSKLDSYLFLLGIILMGLSIQKISVFSDD